MRAWFDDDKEKENEKRDSEYIGHIKGYTYTGHGHYQNNYGCSDTYVVKDENGNIETYREM